MTLKKLILQDERFHLVKLVFLKVLVFPKTDVKNAKNARFLAYHPWFFTDFLLINIFIIRPLVRLWGSIGTRILGYVSVT